MSSLSFAQIYKASGLNSSISLNHGILDNRDRLSTLGLGSFFFPQLVASRGGPEAVIACAASSISLTISAACQ